MSTGQTLLALAAIVLLSIISLNIGSMHVEAVETTVENQETSDAMNIGGDIIEELQSYSYNYDKLDSRFGGLNDVTDESKRRQYTSQIGEVYYATVALSSEQTILHGQMGRRATVKIYEESESGAEYNMLAEFRTAVLPL